MATWIDEYNVDPTIGINEPAFLVERYDTNKGRTTYSLRAAPARTNRSHEPKLWGWCGETNNVSVSAVGLARIARRTKNGRIMLARVEPTAEVLDALGYPELLDE